jgi:hypothetical protein
MKAEALVAIAAVIFAAGTIEIILPSTGGAQRAPWILFCVLVGSVSLWAHRHHWEELRQKPHLPEVAGRIGDD